MIDAGLSVGRIFPYWNEHLQKYNDSWDFAFYDQVFRVVERYYCSPALHSWILINEPTLRDPPIVHMMEGFRRVFREK